MFSNPHKYCIIIVILFAVFFLVGCSSEEKKARKSFLGQTASSQKVSYYKKQYNQVIQMGEAEEYKINVGPSEVNFDIITLE